jgi:hypothetical protein
MKSTSGNITNPNLLHSPRRPEVRIYLLLYYYGLAC